MSDPGNQKNGWGLKLDRHISIGHIISTLLVGATALLWLSNLDKRVDLNTQAINTNTIRIDQAERRQNDALNQILKRLENIETYLRGRDR